MRVILPTLNQFIITAHAEFKDHRVRNVDSGNNRLLSARRYTACELVRVGQKPDVSDGKTVKSIGCKIEGDPILTSTKEGQNIIYSSTNK